MQLRRHVSWGTHLQGPSIPLYPIEAASVEIAPLAA